MKKFNSFAEALMLTTAKPESDSVGPVTGGCCNNKKDMLTKSVEDTLGGLGEPTQPTDGLGDYGDLASDMESSEGGGVEIECLGDEGLIIKFGETAILLPRNVIEKIRSYDPEEESDGEESEESEESEEYESEESDEDEDEDDDDVFKSSVTNVN